VPNSRGISMPQRVTKGWIIRHPVTVYRLGGLRLLVLSLLLVPSVPFLTLLAEVNDR
jgi:hypothetical protein